ncbi:N-acetyltransferase, partial [Klebsiella pneumoniae]
MVKPASRNTGVKRPRRQPLRRIRNNRRQDYSAWRFCITLHAGECFSGRFRSAAMPAEAPLLD